MITPQNLIRHELIGLEVKIAGSTDNGILGLRGRVVDESRNTLTVETGKVEKKLIKDQCVFSFFLPEKKEWVRVEGKLIVARPEDRVKKKHKKW